MNVAEQCKIPNIDNMIREEVSFTSRPTVWLF